MPDIQIKTDENKSNSENTTVAATDEDNFESEIRKNGSGRKDKSICKRNFYTWSL